MRPHTLPRLPKVYRMSKTDTSVFRIRSGGPFHTRKISVSYVQISTECLLYKHVIMHQLGPPKFHDRLFSCRYFCYVVMCIATLVHLNGGILAPVVAKQSERIRMACFVRCASIGIIANVLICAPKSTTIGALYMMARFAHAVKEKPYLSLIPVTSLQPVRRPCWTNFQIRPAFLFQDLGPVMFQKSFLSYTLMLGVSCLNWTSCVQHVCHTHTT